MSNTINEEPATEDFGDKDERNTTTLVGKNNLSRVATIQEEVRRSSLEEESMS